MLEGVAHCSGPALAIKSISIDFSNRSPFDFLSSSDRTIFLLVNHLINFDNFVAFGMIVLMNFLARVRAKYYFYSFLCFF